MKLLATLVALQCAGVAFLVYQALGDEPAPPPAAAVPMTADVHPMPLDEALLRQVVREELAAQLAVTAAPGATRVAVAPAAPRDPEKDRRQRERVEQQIEHYRSVGNISDAQMIELQNDIALLDPISRREMLSKLTRAMNADEIDGRM